MPPIWSLISLRHHSEIAFRIAQTSSLAKFVFHSFLQFLKDIDTLIPTVATPYSRFQAPHQSSLDITLLSCRHEILFFIPSQVSIDQHTMMPALAWAK